MQYKFVYHSKTPRHRGPRKPNVSQTSITLGNIANNCDQEMFSVITVKMSQKNHLHEISYLILSQSRKWLFFFSLEIWLSSPLTDCRLRRMTEGEAENRSQTWGRQRETERDVTNNANPRTEVWETKCQHDHHTQCSHTKSSVSSQ